MKPPTPKPARRRPKSDERSPPKEPGDFKDHLLGGPKFEHFEIKRDRDFGRAVELDDDSL